MKTKLSLKNLAWATFGTSICVVGCTSSPTPATPTSTATPVSSLNQNDLITAPDAPNSYSADTKARDAVVSEYPTLLKRLSQARNKVWAPSLDDLQSQKTLLSEKDTGVARILDGGYYSFANLTHDYQHGADLRLENGSFGVGFAGADYGFLTDIGSTSLDSLSPDLLNFSLNYVTPLKDSDARHEYQVFSDGKTVDGQTYKSYFPAAVGHTYILKSISYGSSDVVVAFQVTREEDSDQSMILAWKLLKRGSVPLLDGNQPSTSTFVAEDLSSSSVSESDREKAKQHEADLIDQLDSSEKTILAPLPEDLAANKDFLNSPNSGIFRLLPNKNAATLLLNPNGNSYCLQDGSRSCNDFGFDYFSENKFALGNSTGLITGLQTTPLEQVSLDTDGVSYLSNYVPPHRNSSLEHAQGVFAPRMPKASSSGHDYVDHIDAKNGYTYVLRSFTYNDENSSKPDSDELVAFQVVRKDTDGSLIIIYKYLK